MPLQDLIAQLQALQARGADRAFVGSSGKLIIGADIDSNGDVIIISKRIKP